MSFGVHQSIGSCCSNIAIENLNEDFCGLKKNRGGLPRWSHPSAYVLLSMSYVTCVACRKYNVCLHYSTECLCSLAVHLLMYYWITCIITYFTCRVWSSVSLCTSDRLAMASSCSTPDCRSWRSNKDVEFHAKSSLSCANKLRSIYTHEIVDACHCLPVL